METNEKVTAKGLLPNPGQLNEGLTVVDNERKEKMGVEAIDIFEVEPMELANWWVVEIEKNGQLGNKAEILSQMTRVVPLIKVWKSGKEQFIGGKKMMVLPFKTQLNRI